MSVSPVGIDQCTYWFVMNTKLAPGYHLQQLLHGSIPTCCSSKMYSVRSQRD